jgi:hypothetical protein
MEKVLIELKKSNNNNFIKSFMYLYNDIMSEFNFESGKTTSINVNKSKSEVNNWLSCCIDTEYIYLQYKLIEEELYSLLEEHNINVEKKENRVSIEFIYSNSPDDTIINSIFAIHDDIGSKFKSKSYTIIIYLNTNCHGGELIFYKETFWNYEKIKTIDVNTEDSKLFTKIVIFDGELLHKPESFSNGARIAFVCQICK